MRTIILKKMMPLAVFVLGVSGAFLTTSMRSAEKAQNNLIGYRNTPQNPCSVEVNCGDDTSAVCRVSYLPLGEQVFGKDQESDTTCPEIRYKP